MSSSSLSLSFSRIKIKISLLHLQFGFFLSVIFNNLSGLNKIRICGKRYTHHRLEIKASVIKSQHQWDLTVVDSCWGRRRIECNDEAFPRRQSLHQSQAFPWRKRWRHLFKGTAPWWASRREIWDEDFLPRGKEKDEGEDERSFRERLWVRDRAMGCREQRRCNWASYWVRIRFSNRAPLSLTTVMVLWWCHRFNLIQFPRFNLLVLNFLDSLIFSIGFWNFNLEFYKN